MASIAIASRWSWIVVLETLSAASTLILVIGAVLEYRAKLEQIAFLVKKVLLGRSTAFERCALGKIVRQTIGPILVVLGIGGELIFGLGAFIAQEAETLADESRLAAANAQLDAAKASLIATQQQLGSMSVEANQLEISLAPRRLFLIKWEDGSSNVDVLKPVVGTEFIVESIPDFEARKAAAEIVAVLRQSGFRVVKTDITEDFTIWNGVTVDAYLGPDSSDPPAQVVKEQDSGNRAKIVGAFLWANEWKDAVDTVALPRGALKSNQLRIRVGFKASPFSNVVPNPSEDEQAKRYAPYATPIDQIKKKVSAFSEGRGVFP